MKKVILLVVMLLVGTLVFVKAADSVVPATPATPATSVAPATPATPATPAVAPAKAEPAKKAAPVAKVKTMRLKGTVASIDAANNTIVISTLGKEKKSVDETVTTDDKTTVMKADKKITLADIVSGDKVSVVYFMSADKKVAKSITVHIPPKQKEPVKK
ncbi:MAG: hypothetical protein PHE88_03460 [Elusimicrobia bacterium]|nr:hypothetical protein [Elusimicrobiota bacterium]